MSLQATKIKNNCIELYKKSLKKSEKNWPFDIRKGLHCINRHLFDTDYSVNKMRERCDIADTNFSTRFRNYVGMTPREYIVFHRIHAGKLLLRHEKLDHLHVTDIGFTVGYEKPSSFSMAFKKQTGITPKAWKRESKV
jgi:AraC-like DNA-binding protein